MQIFKRLGEQFDKTDIWVLTNYSRGNHSDHGVKAIIDTTDWDESELADGLAGRTYIHSCKFYDDCGDNLYLFGAWSEPYALILADSWESAYEIYLDEFVGDCGEPESAEQAESECWYCTGSGKWVDECTIANIVSLGPRNYAIGIEIELLQTA